MYTDWRKIVILRQSFFSLLTQAQKYSWTSYGWARPQSISQLWVESDVVLQSSHQINYENEVEIFMSLCGLTFWAEIISWAKMLQTMLINLVSKKLLVPGTFLQLRWFWAKGNIFCTKYFCVKKISATNNISVQKCFCVQNIF